MLFGREDCREFEFRVALISLIMGRAFVNRPRQKIKVCQILAGLPLPGVVADPPIQQ